MKILGIDPGSHCGWAYRDGRGKGRRVGVVWESGVWDLAARRHEGGGMRYLRCRKYLQDVLDLLKPEVVVYEEVRRHMGTDAAHVYGGIVAVISEECEARKIPYRGIPVGTIKKHATGKGNADKVKMGEAARYRWPDYDFADDNEVDARFIADTAATELE